LLDLATPFLAALLQLGEAPPPKVIGLGILTAFAGYTAVYALNDVVDYRVDKEDIQRGRVNDTGGDLDAIYVRHPMAQGLLSFKEGLLWAVGWALTAVIGAYLLNPVCAFIFILGGILEAVYCILLRVSYLRVVVSGVVKTLGAIAAVFAVDPNPSPLFLAVLFLWLFFWEVGGQNVPNDWTDVEEDKKLQAETVPVRFGADGAGVIILVSLTISVALSALLPIVAPADLGTLFIAGVLLAGIYLLIVPAVKLYRTKNRGRAAALFNRASHYPLIAFAIILIGWLL
jgi:4-hydroxybenzoate polyprenyltransferase